MSKRTILSFVIIMFSLIATAILLPVISYPYAEKTKDPDSIEMIILLVSFGLFFLGVVIVPIAFVIWIVKSESKPNLSLK